MLLGSGEDQVQSGSGSNHSWNDRVPTQCRSRSPRDLPNRRLRFKTQDPRSSLWRMKRPSSHSDAHITPPSAHTPDAHTPIKKPAKSDRSRIMSDRRSKKEQRETSRSEDVVITQHRVGKRKDADDVCPMEPKDCKDMMKKNRRARLKCKQKSSSRRRRVCCDL